MNKFIIPATLKLGRKRKGVLLELVAEDRADALFQAHHGVIEMNVRKKFPNGLVSYDLRKLAKLKTNNL